MYVMTQFSQYTDYTQCNSSEYLGHASWNHFSNHGSTFGVINVETPKYEVLGNFPTYELRQ